MKLSRKEIEESLELSSTWDDEIWSHGLNAYSGEMEESVIEKAQGLLEHPEWELATSNSGEELGEVGLYLQGYVSDVFSRDVGSEIEKYSGQRICSEWAETYRITDKYDMWKKGKLRAKDTDLYNSYLEAFLKDSRIVSVWVKKVYPDWTSVPVKKFVSWAADHGFNIDLI